MPMSQAAGSTTPIMGVSRHGVLLTALEPMKMDARNHAWRVVARYFLSSHYYAHGFFVTQCLVAIALMIF
jgi:hypothetical protein